jgi:hypothetical protein
MTFTVYIQSSVMYFLHGRIVVNMSLFKDCDSFVDQKSKMATIVTQCLECKLLVCKGNTDDIYSLHSIKCAMSCGGDHL